jgi:hypothetical protein
VGSSANTPDRQAREAANPTTKAQETTMSFFHEYSLLFAVAIPVAVIVAIEVALWASGERGASLLPGIARYPTVMSQVEIAGQMVAAEPIAMMPDVEPSTLLAGAPAKVARVSANDKVVREAA